MISFKHKDYTTTCPNWSRHHKTIGAKVARAYDDGTIDYPKNKQVAERVKRYEKDMIPHAVSLIDMKTGKTRTATDFYLICKNADYQEAYVPDYDIGAMNTKETLHIRLKFVIDRAVAYLDYALNTSGSYAMDFFTLITSDLDGLIDDIVDKSKGLEEDGIKRIDQDGEIDYQVVVVADYGEITDITLSEREFKKALVGVECYRFDMDVIKSEPTSVKANAGNE